MRGAAGVKFQCDFSRRSIHEESYRSRQRRVKRLRTLLLLEMHAILLIDADLLHRTTLAPTQPPGLLQNTA
jgi:hypothetical protein